MAKPQNRLKNTFPEAAVNFSAKIWLSYIYFVRILPIHTKCDVIVKLRHVYIKGLIQRFLQCPYYKSPLFQSHYLLVVLLFISVYCD